MYHAYDQLSDDCLFVQITKKKTIDHSISKYNLLYNNKWYLLLLLLHIYTHHLIGKEGHCYDLLRRRERERERKKAFA